MDYIELHIASHHSIPIEQDWHEQNPGVGLVRKGYVMGWYINSVGRETAYVGKRKRVMGPVSIEASLATGYAYPVVPMLAVQVQAGPLSLRAMPMVTRTEIGIVWGASWTVALR